MGKKTINGLPVFEARMTSKKCGVLRVSLVDSPAVESDFVAYDKQEQKALYKITDEEKQRVFGCVLRADYPIYRRDKDNGEYYIVFKADEIRAFAQKYLAESKQNNVDLEHDGTDIEGAEMVQYFIKDTAGGIAPEGFDDVADGSLFAEYQITDADLWDRIKDGEFHGFSVEIIHAVLPAEYNQIKENMRKSVLAKAKELLAQIVAEEENEMSAQAPANENPETPAEQEYKAISTDKGVIRVEGDELEEGVIVHGEDEDGNQTALEDGDYKTNDNKIIVIKDGKVAEIKDAPIEEEKKPAEEKKDEQSAQAPAEDEKKAELRKAIAEKCEQFSVSYDEKSKKIHEAIRAILPAMFADYFYMYECGDDFAVIETYDENYNPRYFRFAIVWDGEEPAVDGEGVEGHIGFIPDVAEPAKENEDELAKVKEDFASQIAAKDAEIADLKAKLEAPAGQSAHDAYRAKKGTYAGANPIEDAMAFLK